jgi:hypothetical protein
VVCSINSLDHVDDVEASIAELARITAAGGAFLLSVEIGHEPTPAEPISLWFEILDDPGRWCDVVWRQAFEMPAQHYVNDAYHEGVPFRADAGRHPGVLVARLERRPG